MIAVPTACGFGSPPATPTCGKMQGLALLVQEVSIRSGPRRSRCLRAVYARHRALHNEIRPVNDRIKVRAKLGRPLANVERVHVAGPGRGPKTEAVHFQPLTRAGTS
jgi:hypothetical protein